MDDAQFAEGDKELSGRPVQAATAENTLNGCRLWSLDPPSSVQQEGQYEAKVAVFRGPVTIPGSNIARIYWRKPFPREAYAFTVGSQGGALLKEWNLTKDYCEIYGTPGTFACWIVAYGS